VLRRGLLIIGKRIREERDRDRRLGRAHRPLSHAEHLAWLAVMEAQP
jgi:hypothetical protein